MDDPRPEADNGAAEPQHPYRRARAPKVRCAAVVPPGIPEPADLRSAMRRRGIEMSCFHDVYAALLHLLACAEDDSAALIFVEPALLEHNQARRLARAGERRLHRLTLWSFASENGERARLRPYETPRADPSAPPRQASEEATPRLRLAGFHEEDADEPVLEDETPEPQSYDAEAPSDLLTSEEIAMLLDDGPGGREENKA